MGMQVRLVVYADDEALAARAARAAFVEINRLDGVFSDYRRDSEVTLLSDGTGAPRAVSEELFAVLEAADRLSRLSGGAFDVTAGVDTAKWKQAISRGRLPDDTDGRAATVASPGNAAASLRLDPARRTVALAPGKRLDLGAIAKGFVLDRALAVARAHGSHAVLIEAGGDIVVGGAPPGRAGWRIGLPHAGGCTVQLRDAAISTSGDAEQFVVVEGTRYSHVIDGRTGEAVTGRRTATVVATDGATADALATALTVLEREAGQALLAAYPGARARVDHGTDSRPSVASPGCAELGGRRPGG